MHWTTALSVTAAPCQKFSISSSLLISRWRRSIMYKQQVKGLLAKMLLQTAAFQTAKRRIDLHIFATVDLPGLPCRQLTSSRPIVHRRQGGWISPSHSLTGQSPILTAKHANDYIAPEPRGRQSKSSCRLWRRHSCLRHEESGYSTTASINCKPLSIFISPFAD